MPPPLVQIPSSVSRGGTCKSNLRGTGATSTLYDVANPSRTFSKGNLTSIPISGGGPWSNTINYAYSFSGGNPRIRYPSLLSTARSGTILIRLYIPTPDEPLAGVGAVFQNGAPGTDGFGILYDYVPSRLYFIRLDSSPFDDYIEISSDPLSYDTWYQFSVRFETTTVSATDFTSVTSYQNGIITKDNLFFNAAIVTPTAGNTTLFFDAVNGNNFFGRITDFAFLEAQLSNDQLRLYATAPYI